MIGDLSTWQGMSFRKVYCLLCSFGLHIRLMMEELAQYVDATKTSKSSQDDDSSLK